jgi:hypothetical protein
LPEYVHRFQDQPGAFCNISLICSDGKKIQTDKVFLAENSDVFATVLTTKEDVTSITLNYSYDIVSAALSIVQQISRSCHADQHKLAVKPFQFTASWMIKLMTFALGYKLQEVVSLCYQYLNPKNDCLKIETMDDIMDIWRFTKTLPNTCQTKKLQQSCEKEFAKHHEATLKTITGFDLDEDDKHFFNCAMSKARKFDCLSSLFSFSIKHHIETETKYTELMISFCSKSFVRSSDYLEFLQNLKHSGFEWQIWVNMIAKGDNFLAIYLQQTLLRELAKNGGKTPHPGGESTPTPPRM